MLTHLALTEIAMYQNRRLLELKIVLRQLRTNTTAQPVHHQRLVTRQLENPVTQYSKSRLIPQTPRATSCGAS